MSGVLVTRLPQERYFCASFPFASRMPTSLSSSSLRARDGRLSAAKCSCGDHTPGGAWRPGETRRRTFPRLLVFAIATILLHGPDRENIPRLADAELNVGTLKNAASGPKTRHSFPPL